MHSEASKKHLLLTKRNHVYCGLLITEILTSVYQGRDTDQHLKEMKWNKFKEVKKDNWINRKRNKLNPVNKNRHITEGS